MLPPVSSSYRLTHDPAFSPRLKRSRPESSSDEIDDEEINQKRLEKTTPSPAKRVAIEEERYLDAASFLSPSKSHISPASGPSPGKIISLAKMPTTEERHGLRVGKILSEAFEPESLEDIIEELTENPSLKELIKDNVLAERTKGLKNAVRKKCFTITQIGIYDIEDKMPVLRIEKLADETFISSCKKHHGLVSIEKGKIRSSINRKKPVPLFDFHSERSAILWLEENISTVVSALEKDKTKFSSKTVINCNLLTKASSCPHCVQVLGIEKYHRIADTLQAQLVKDLKLTADKIPQVTLIHQGLKHHHRKTIKEKGLPQAEFYCSKSFSSMLDDAAIIFPPKAGKKLF